MTSHLTECYLCGGTAIWDAVMPISPPFTIELDEAVMVCVACVRNVMTAKVAARWRREQKAERKGNDSERTD